ncbi:MAG: DNA repair protein RecO [Rhodothermales bacterium]|nr:DNA repair protein RecO [Rhodothermales bacterium]
MTDRPEILRTDSVVLHQMEYGETSRIVRLLTREKGSMSVIVKGARTSSNRFGTTLEPMSCIQAVIHVKPGRGLQTLSETSHLVTFPGLRASLERIRIGLRVVELTRAVAQEGERNDPLFSLVYSTLTALDACHERPENLWPFFQMRLSRVLGFGPSFEPDLVRGLEGDVAVLDLDSGRISATGDAAGRGYPMRASRRAIRAFAVFTRSNLTDVLRMTLDPATLREVESLIAAYMKFHIEDAWPHRSAAVFAQFDPSWESDPG